MSTGIKGRLIIGFSAVLALSACEDGQGPKFLQGNSGGASTQSTANSTSKIVERDVEAPEIFQVTDKGLWDGRPSLGGVWVAHPSARDPERVIIRNPSNTKFVIGVLYRPERQTPGPAIQVSSDAAEALGMLAGKPADLSITALKNETVSTPAPTTDVDPESAPTKDLAETPQIKATSLDPIEAASAALDAAEGKPATPPAAVTPKPATPKPASSSSLAKAYIQIGIFSVQANANNTAEALRRAGMVPTIKPGKSSGKEFWRVIVGPAGTSAERSQLLKKIKGLGFNDAYYVTN
ncbi:MAG: SPOR domain-containing protein [Maritimibacter sp.]